MVLNHNGQAVTLSREDFGGRVGYGDLKAAKAVTDAMKSRKEATFAMTFPGGTHDVWLRYWMAAAGISQKSVKIITIPPPQMVANMKVGNMDGYCVGEPWPGTAVKDKTGGGESPGQHKHSAESRGHRRSCPARFLMAWGCRPHSLLRLGIWWRSEATSLGFVWDAKGAKGSKGPER